MNETARKLLELQEVDTEIFELERQLKAYPQKLKSLENEAREADDQLSRARSKMKRMQVERNEKETDIKQKQQTIQRFENEQMKVKSNKEYQAITHQIQTTQEEIGDLETEILEMLDREEKQQERINDAQEAARHAGREYGEEKDRLEGLIAEKRERADDLRSMRKGVLSAIDEEWAEEYESLNERYPGAAIAQGKGNACGGCHMNLLASTEQALTESDNLARCPHCSRLLYNPKRI